MTPERYDRAVAGFHSAAAGVRDWADVLDDLAQSLRAWATPLMGVDKRTGTMLFTHHGGPAPPSVALDYIRGYHAIDPRAQLLMSLPYGTWVHCHEHFDQAYVDASPFYQDFLLPHGGRYVSGTKVFEDQDTVMVLGLHRDPATGPFTLGEREVLARLARHVERAMEIYRRLRDAFAEAGAGRELLDKFTQPMLLVDELGGIRFRNAAAAGALADGNYVVDRGGILTCVDHRSHGELMAALQDLGLQGAAHASARCARRFLRIRRTSSEVPIVATLTVVRPETSLNAFGRNPAALVLFHDPAAARQLDPFLVAEMFDLTPAESRVALSLREGHASGAIAKIHGVSLATVRSQIQSIFAKTGVNRQADLIRLIEGLVSLDTLSR